MILLVAEDGETAIDEDGNVYVPRPDAAGAVRWQRTFAVRPPDEETLAIFAEARKTSEAAA